MKISVRLLNALGLWVSPDTKRNRHINQLVVRDSELLATDGHRLVRFPFPDAKGLSFGVGHGDLLEIVSIANAIAIADVDISPSAQGVTAEIGLKVSFRGKRGLSEDFPSRAVLDGIAPRNRTSAPPAIAADPLFLAHIAAVEHARPDEKIGSSHGVELISWGTPTDALEFRGILSSSHNGDHSLRPRYVLMPVRMLRM